MRRETVGNYYIFNGKEYVTEDIEFFDHIVSTSVYEVIRIINGIPLFLEEHLERMRKSADLLGEKINKSDEEIMGEIFKLIKFNKINYMNVKLLCSNLDKKNQDFFTYFIESHYPDQEIYKRGIDTILYNSERENPNAKIINTDLRERINRAIKKANAYEAILVNRDGYITEGSRSNMFFLKGGKVYTAPSGKVLLGVTRSKIMKVCASVGIKVIEQAIHINDINKLDGAFMTGTSVNVLPIYRIDERIVDSVQNPIIQKIAQGYREEMRDYIENKRMVG